MVFRPSFTRWQRRDFAGVVGFALTTAACLLVTGDALAKPPLRVIYVCTEDASCESFAARLKGQTSDLNVKVVRVSRAHEALPEPLEEAVAKVDQIAAAQDAEVALWWRAHDLVALLRRPPPGRVLVRRVRSGKPLHNGALGTADLESGSLISRTAIVAALNGTQLGVPRQAALHEQRAAAPAAALPAAAPPGQSASARWQGAVALGGNAMWDGLPSDPSVGLEARVGAKYKRLRLGLLWVERRTVEISVPQARGSIASRQVGAVVGLDVFQLLKLNAGVEARGGWVWAQVAPLSGPFEEKVGFTRKFVGIAIHLRYALMPGRLSAWAGGAVDWVEEPFTVGLRSPQGYQAMWYMSAVQPALAVGLEVLFPQYL